MPEIKIEEDVSEQTLIEIIELRSAAAIFKAATKLAAFGSKAAQAWQ